MSTFDRFVDDATTLRPAAPPVHDAAAEYAARRAEVAVGSFVLPDTDLPRMRGFAGPLAVVVTGGAGQISGPAGLCTKLRLRLARIEVTLRDLDDLPGNARRVTAAVDDALAAGSLEETTRVHVGLPDTGSEAGWLAAADEVAAAGHRLSLGAGGDRTPTDETLLGWIDAALDRETPFGCTGLTRAVAHVADDGTTGHGFLNVLVATALLFDGLPDPLGALRERDRSALVGRAGEVDLVRARRWFTSFGSTDVPTSLADLAGLPDLGGQR